MREWTSMRNECIGFMRKWTVDFIKSVIFKFY